MKHKKALILISFLLLGFLILEPTTLLGNVPGDFEPDCDVDFNDFAVLASAWLTQNGDADYNSKCDLSDPNDGMIDEKDLAVFIEFWLTKHPCDMAYIPAGTFQMGDSFNEGDSDEFPVHTVTLDSFYMCKYEVTNVQYCEYLNSALGISIYISGGIVYGNVNNQPYCHTYSYDSESQIEYSGGVFKVRTKGIRDMSNDPIVRISWYGAVAYCNWRSQQEEKEVCYDLNYPNWSCDFSKNGYRLPTEAEWEYAARGGLASNRFPWGDTISHVQANYYCRWGLDDHPYFPYDVSETPGYHPLWFDFHRHPYSSPVGFFDGTMKYNTDYNWPGSATSYQTTSGANNYGLYDMAGDAWEWCNDWYGIYSSDSQTNPTGPPSGTQRVIRGSSWDPGASWCRVANRDKIIPSWCGGNGNGFRLCLGIN